MNRFLLASVWILSMSTSAFAIPSIEFVSHQMLANTPGQVYSIVIHGGDPVSGLDLKVQVADGGPAAGGIVVGPRITAVHLVNGTIFEGNATAQQTDLPFPQLATASVHTLSGTVPADGVLAYVTIDSTGFTTGSWPVLLAGTAAGDTDLAGTPAQITNGSLSPTPGSGILSFLGLGGLLLLRRRPT